MIEIKINLTRIAFWAACFDYHPQNSLLRVRHMEKAFDVLEKCRELWRVVLVVLSLNVISGTYNIYCPKIYR